MRELNMEEIEAVDGGYISGYQGAGAVLAVLGTGAAFSTAPLSAIVITFGVSVAGGLAIAQFIADIAW